MTGAERRGGPIGEYLARLHARVAPIDAGKVADYIPKLAEANAGHFAIAIATLDGEVYAVGDADVPFTIQSVSKPYMFGLALEELGRQQVLKHVGVEPTGEAFNATVLDEDNNRPYNPMVNAGAIAVSALVRGDTYAARRTAMTDLFARFAGRPVEIDEAVFHSERDTGDRNRAIAALMAQAAMLEGDTNEILDLYFSQCSVLVTCRDLALMAATLANGGVQPVTGERALSPESVTDVLTVMNSCGMYNYAGQWSYEIGIPAKSGVSGSIMAVIPGQIGIAAFSPPLDSFGNSVRAIAACKQLAEDFGLHVFRSAAQGEGAIRGELRGDSVRSKRRRTAHERSVLDARGGDIAILEAQGALVFGSAERLLRRAEALLDHARFVIVDLRRVFSADVAARNLLVALFEDATRRGASLVYVHPEPARIGANFARDLAALAPTTAQVLFADRDAALEWCENQLITAEPRPNAQATFALDRLDIFRGLSTPDLKFLESCARSFVFEPGQHVLREGEPGQLFFVIAQGNASVRLQLADARSVRLASVGPGAAVGDMALLDGGPRSADVIADERVVCYGFSVEELQAHAGDRPALLPTLYANLARDLVERLRGSNTHIRALEQ